VEEPYGFVLDFQVDLTVRFVRHAVPGRKFVQCQPLTRERRKQTAPQRFLNTVRHTVGTEDQILAGHIPHVIDQYPERVVRLEMPPVQPVAVNSGIGAEIGLH